MTPTEIRTLARVLGAVRPSRTVAPTGGDPAAARALADRLDTVLETAGVEQPAVAIIADSLVAFLLGWRTRRWRVLSRCERAAGPAARWRHAD